MTIMKLSQVCAYANWPTEAFEVWKWCKSGIAPIIRMLQKTYFLDFGQRNWAAMKKPMWEQQRFQYVGESTNVYCSS